MTCMLDFVSSLSSFVLDNSQRWKGRYMWIGHALKTIPLIVCYWCMDATNAFISLNRQTSLPKILHICPRLAKIIVNHYRQAVDVFVSDTKLKSEEGGTQGDPLAMPFYALATTPPVRELSIQGLAK